MSYSVEALITELINQNNHNLNISFPAKVFGTDNLKDGFIDVQPLVNYTNPMNHTNLEYPVLYDIPVVFPSTKNSTICFPVSQGDFVYLLFQSADIQSFVAGNTEKHNSFVLSHGNLENCVAVVGFMPYTMSCFNPNNYKEEFSSDNLNIVHNKNTEREASVTIASNGEITLKSPVSVKVESPNVEVEAETIEANNSIINTNGDVNIKGKSVFEHMATHTHIGNQGSPTSPPTG